MPLSSKELKILDKLQREFNDQVKREQEAIISRLAPLMAKIRPYDDKAKKIIKSEEERKTAPDAILHWETDYETHKSVTDIYNKISPYLSTTEILRKKYHQYDREKKAVNSWFENAKTCNSLNEIGKLDQTALCTSFHDSSKIQQTFSKIDSFTFYNINPYSIRSQINRLWNNLFSKNSITQAEATIISPDAPHREALAASPPEVAIFSLPKGEKLLKSLSKEVDAHKISSEALADSMAHTLEHTHDEKHRAPSKKNLADNEESTKDVSTEKVIARNDIR
jgi:hypothetical protein